MSRIVKEAKLIGTKNNVELWLMHIDCDTMQDLPAATAYGSGTLICIGSTAHIIADNATLEIDSAGNWIQQQAGSSTYTRAEIDDLLAVKIGIDDEGNAIPDSANLNDYTRGGKYYGGNSAGNSVLNLPVANGSFNFSLEVKIASPVHTLQYLTILRTTDNPYLYRRRYYNGSWSSWYRFEGVAVT